jgi:hypothetical protein
MSPVEIAWSAGPAEKDKSTETEKAAAKEKQAEKAEGQKPTPKDTRAEKKPAKKPKATQPTPRGRFSEGATKASGAGIVEKAVACFGQAPKIEKIDPDEVKAGDKVTIIGKDFGMAGCLNSISFGPGNPAKFEQKDETEITAIVPSIKKSGMVLLTLTTASGEDSKPVFIE